MKITLRMRSNFHTQHLTISPETGLYSLTSDEANVYKALHAGIKLPAVPEVTHARIDEAFRKMKATWQKKGLTFPEGQVKIMQTLAVGKEGQAYSTCSGVAIERPNRFIFVSKLSYFSPYAMIEFGSREEMVEYLFGPPDQMPNNGYGYMILLNDEVVWTCTSKRIANKTSGGDVQ